mmetsp:Transcript_110980/g.345888  ORF Transcript_110980/g.345888 Transcript_110980/m.345888 type:complete len:229 (+) Transcript_110980:156-842(+)
MKRSLRPVCARGSFAALVTDNVAIQNRASVKNIVHALLHEIVFTPSTSPGQGRTRGPVDRVREEHLFAEDLDGAVQLRAARPLPAVGEVHGLPQVRHQPRAQPVRKEYAVWVNLDNKVEPPHPLAIYEHVPNQDEILCIQEGIRLLPADPVLPRVPGKGHVDLPCVHVTPICFPKQHLRIANHGGLFASKDAAALHQLRPDQALLLRPDLHDGEAEECGQARLHWQDR